MLRKVQADEVPWRLGEIFRLPGSQPDSESHALIVAVYDDGMARVRIGSFDVASGAFTPSRRGGHQGHNISGPDGTNPRRPQLVGALPIEVAEKYWRDERRSWVAVGNVYYRRREGGQYLVTAVELAEDGLPRSFECLVGERAIGSTVFRPNGTVLTFEAPPDFDHDCESGMFPEDSLALRASVLGERSTALR